jgi:hypothetical protein
MVFSGASHWWCSSSGSELAHPPPSISTTTRWRTGKDKRGEWHLQCNCIIIITAKKVEERAKAKLEVESNYVDLFGIDSSQSQNNPPNPPSRRRKRLLEERQEVDDGNEDEDEDSRSNDGGGGKQGRQYGGGGREGECMRGFSIGVSA